MALATFNMLRSIANRFLGQARFPAAAVAMPSPFPSFASAQLSSNDNSYEHPISLEDMPYVHHKKRPRFRDYVKFKSPRRRASKLMHELQTEAVAKSKAEKPAVFGVDYRVGDAIECEVVEQGGTNKDTTETKRVRGVVIGKFNKHLSSSVLIRDVVLGITVERQVPLHSPTTKSIKLLERNFIYKGRRKVKRAKLYFLRDRNPNGKSCAFDMCCASV